MPHPLEAGTIRILKPDGSTAGTGFLVSKQLVVTCAHVVDAAGVKPGEFIDFKFHLGDLDIQKANVLETGWSVENDVAVLELTEKPPKWIHPIIMQSSRAMEGRAFQGLGYPNDGPVQIRWPQGNISGRVDVDGYTTQLLQLQGKEIDKGLSGSAVVDRTTRRVIGMITAYQDISRPSTAENVRFGYAVPMETVWQVYPELEKEFPPLPKRSPLVEGIHLLPYGYDFRIQNFLNEYLGTPEQPEPFGGREDALKALDDWLDSNCQRLLLAAPAGRGKSALLVRWLDRLISREDLALVFVPVSVRFRTNLASAFFASLAARLAYIHGEDVPTSEMTSTDDWQRLAKTYLVKPLMHKRKLLVVVDGLDEGGGWEATADLIPADLPANVYVIASARFLAGDTDAQHWLSRLGWEHPGKASTLDLNPLDSDGVADVLFQMGVPLGQISHRVDIVTELYRLSEGDPLLVNLYVEDLWSRGEGAAGLKAEDLRNIKPGIDGYFERWWEDQKKLWSGNALNRERDTKLVFNLLCCAMGPLTRNDLLSLAPGNQLDTYLIEEAIDTLKRFVIGIPDERKDEVGYVFSHPKFRDFFWKKLSKREKMELEKYFLDCGETTLNCMISGSVNSKIRSDIPDYIVQYYAEHLRRADQPIEKYLPLIHHPQWGQAWFTIEGAYSGYLRDVHFVWDRCKELDRSTVEKTEKPHYFCEQIRCALIESSLHGIADDIPSQLVALLKRDKIWTLTQVWVFIRQMPDPDQQQQALSSMLPYLTDEELLGALEVAWAIEDKSARACALGTLAAYLPEIVDEVWEAARNIQDGWDHVKVLVTLAENLPEGELGQVLESARSIQKEGDRAKVLITLAEHLPEGELGQVFVLARAIRNEAGRASVLSALAARLPEIVSEALKATRAIQSELERARVLSALAPYLPEGELRQDLKTVQEIQDVWVRAYVLKALVANLPEDELGQILEAARNVQDEGVRADVLKALARRLPERELEQILEAARGIQDEGERANVLIVLAWYLPERELGQILAAARGIHAEGSRAYVLSALAAHQPEIVIEALEAAQVIQDEKEHAHVLNALVTHFPEIIDEVLEEVRTIRDEGARAEALSTLTAHRPEIITEVLEVTRAIRNERTHASVLTTLAEHLPEKELGQVLERVREIQNEWSRAKVLSVLAGRLSEKELGYILEAARAIQDEGARADVLIALAARLPEVVNEALEATRAIQHDMTWASMLHTLAEYLPEKELEQSLEAAQTIQDEGARASALRALVAHLPERDLGNVLEAARTIQNEGNRAYVLSLLAKHLPEGKLEQILEAARGIQDKEARSGVLSALAVRLPQVVGEALETARTIQSEWTRADVLSVLAEHLPEIIDEAILESAKAIPNEWDRARMLSFFVVLLRDMPIGKLYDVIENILPILSQRSRSHLFCDIAALLPIILQVDKKEFGQEILQAIRDVSNWWV